MSNLFNLERFGLTSEKMTPDEKNLILPQNIILTKTTVKNLEKIIYPLREERNILLVGDVGVGKNALIYYINQLRNLPTVRFSFNQDTMSEDLIGSFQILPDGFHWQDGPLITAMKEGYTFVADEMNLASPEILKRFLSVLKNKSLMLSEKDTSSCEARDRFHFVATQNPSRGFEGRKTLPIQIQKYFTIIYIDSYPIAEQVEIIRALFPKAPASLVEGVIELQNRLEEKIKKSEIAKNSLEHFHFNIRSAQRFWHRVLKDFPKDKKIVINVRDHHFIFNLFRFYVQCFPNQLDRETSFDMIKDIFNLNLKEMNQYAAIFLNQDVTKSFRLLIDNSKVRSKQYELDPLPITSGRLKYLEEIHLSLENNENLLLEGEESARIGELIDIVANAHGQKVSHIYLSQGMHTSDILGSLRPVKSHSKSQGSEKVQWVDGPLTRAIRNKEWVVLANIETAGSEIIEKLNMLLDDASQLLLPPEAKPSTLIKKSGKSRIIAIKYFRQSRNHSTISRAFRNRFVNIIISKVPDHELAQSAFLFFNSFFQIDVNKEMHISVEKLIEKLVEFHTRMNIALLSQKLHQDSVNIQPYQEENLLRWVRHLNHWNNEQTSFEELVIRGAEVHYISALSDELGREWGRNLLRKILQDLPLDKIESKLSTMKKKILKSPSVKKMTWDPKKYFREATTGKAKPRFSGSPLKKGVRINTPETGGNTKEGEHAWYGRDTLGNLGVGVPQGGGGAWGYRTQQIFDDFLKKYSPKWDYNINLQLDDYYEYFGNILEQVDLNLDNALDTQTNTTKEISSKGHRVNVRKYLSYLFAQGSDRIFEHSRIFQKEERLKGMEIIFLVNKGRRLFNFKYSMASVVALQSAIEMLNDHLVSFKVFGYSDLDNIKTEIDIVEYTEETSFYWGESLPDCQKKDIFDKLILDWSGDTVEEYAVLEKVIPMFSLGAKAKIVVLISDFRGHRARQSLMDDVLKRENQILKKAINDYSRQEYIFLGVQTGTRNIAEHIFNHFIWINADNFDQAPFILAEKLQDIIVNRA